jgi:hypothetical protein
VGKKPCPENIDDGSGRPEKPADDGDEGRVRGETPTELDIPDGLKILDVEVHVQQVSNSTYTW